MSSAFPQGSAEGSFTTFFWVFQNDDFVRLMGESGNLHDLHKGLSVVTPVYSGSFAEAVETNLDFNGRRFHLKCIPSRKSPRGEPDAFFYEIIIKEASHDLLSVTGTAQRDGASRYFISSDWNNPKRDEEHSDGRIKDDGRHVVLFTRLKISK